MNIPSDLKYTQEHEWIRDNGDGTVTVGITDFAQGELGDIVFVELEPEGFEFDKTVSELFAPVDGEIVEVNEELEDDPEIVNNDPYDKGWMVKIKVSDESQIKELLTAEDYQDVIDN